MWGSHICLETGRFENLPVEKRLCLICKSSAEDEKHVLLHCRSYDHVRQQLFTKAIELEPNFLNSSEDDKLIFILSNNDIMKITAKTCYTYDSAT